ncbi:MAG TPA: methylated-DNA--[protein]-cysteine S-methyltransferase [Methylomirabilota bacterium]|nr:methylated-DNA--[protein]-cysteine S-methyltransferase [Methylomirabilota bacterium]
MSEIGFLVFETPIGVCGIVWGDRGVVAVQLPEANEAAARARLGRDYPGARESAPPPDVERAREAIVALLRGEPSDLSFVELDMSRVAPFNQRVYEIARTIPPGSTLTYGEIAARMGKPGAARDVGAVLGQNPFSIIVPCHRVVAAGGKIGGFSARGGVRTKLRLLSIEGVQAPGTAPLFERGPLAGTHRA